MAQNDHDPRLGDTTEPGETTVLTTTEARQAKNYGIWRILVVSLTLAVAAGAALLAAGYRI